VNAVRLALGDAPAANDNAYAAGKPVVRIPRGRSDAIYARSDNVILPLRFAQRIPGWQPEPAPPGAMPRRG
jgi:hypothetical protein